MNNQEARLILSGYRPGGQDASDPLVAEALEQAHRDPELQKWFAEEQAFDLRVQARLRTALLPPPELKGNLLALKKMARTPSMWRSPLWLAAAAALVLLLGFEAISRWPANTDKLDLFRKTMVRYSMSEREHITFENPDLAKIQLWLQGRGVKTGFELPAGLRGKPAEGCRVIDWNGHTVSLICFVLSSGDHVDLFVMDGAGLPEVTESDAPQFARTGTEMTAIWSKGGHVYLLTGEGDKRILQKLLRQS